MSAILLCFAKRKAISNCGNFFWFHENCLFNIKIFKFLEFFPFAGTIIRSSNSLHGLSSAIFWITQNTFALRHQNLPDDESLKKENF